MSEKDKPFTVNDRRHFTPDGRAREEPADVASPSASPAPADTLPSPPGVPGESESPGPSDGGARQEPRARRGAQPGPAEPVDFGRFLLSLGAQAGMLLDAEPGDEGEAEALEGARQIISILEMLQGKTEGRRTDEESRILEQLLFQLRLAYVERAKRS